MNRFCSIVLLLVISCGLIFAQTPETFLPPESPVIFEATRANNPITIDGKLEEVEWGLTATIEGLVQQNPYQGQLASQDTKIKLLYNEQYLYVSAVCYQPKDLMRVQNFRRDFDFDLNDLFGIAIDGYKDKRNATIFQATPKGNMRDLQVQDGTVFNIEWDALWQVRTSIHDEYWVAEMAIPWKVLRYPEGATEFGVIFSRNIRSNNEVASLPAVPRVFTVYRMAYEGILKGIQPPPPSANVQINPYVLADANRSTASNNGDELEIAPKIGGEVKWAITPSTILDVTVNTDFAQADVDRQVINFQRYSVFFPERRQFFLENANLFRTSITNWIQPFFSRRIGLDDTGNPIQIDGGLRLVSQNEKRQLGAIAMRQRATEDTPASHFGVLRYAQNLSKQSRLGGMMTWRNDGVNDNKLANNNYTATIDGLYLPNQSYGIKGMLSTSLDQAKGRGYAGQFLAFYENNLFYIGLLEYYNKDYLPGAGLLILEENYFMTSPAMVFDLRPSWLPKTIRRIRPEAYAYIFNSSEDARPLFGYWGFKPLALEFQNGASASYTYEPNWQVLENSFFPLGIEIEKGKYNYIRHRFSLSSDISAKVGASLRAEVGNYFDGTLNTYTFAGRIAPSPHLELQLDYQLNDYNDLGIETVNGINHLLGVNARLALNPRVQLINFYQWNSSVNRAVWNVRFSWEYRPLSFIYLVFNNNQFLNTDTQNRFSQQQYIGKIAFLRQL
jgi:uncharacterized protein YkvS